jgi:MFS family permease
MSFGHDPYLAFRSGNFRRYAAGNACSMIGLQMFGLAVGWEIYERTSSATALGLVGLFQALPVILFALPAGHLVDRFNRKTIIIVNQVLLVLASAALGCASLWHTQIPDLYFLKALNRTLFEVALFFGDRAPVFADRHIPILYMLLLFIGAGRAVSQPARSAMLPQLVSPEAFPNAVTWNSSIFEVSNVLGPALGGALLGMVLQLGEAGWAYPTVYFLTAFCQLLQLLVFIPIRLRAMPGSQDPLTLRSLLAGIRFVWSTRIILATITLDMFAVLLGGATALLPMVAKEILQVGPMGLGLLRSATSIGAIGMALSLAHQPPMKRAGRNMLWAVSGFGAAIILFGLSRNFYLSFLMLVLSGACDNISVIVRHTLIQVLTPNELRGRVSAVNSVFISCSNELGALESGLTAAFFGSLASSAASGAVLSIVGGGVGTIVVVLAVALLIPEVRRIGPLRGSVEPEETGGS